MKKIFTLFAAMLVALTVVSAERIELKPGTAQLRTTLAASSTKDGDTIVLAAGDYIENGDYTLLNKNVVITAASSTKPVVKFDVPAQLSGGKRVEFKGIKFDATNAHTKSWYEHIIYVTDSVDNNRLIFDDCEFYNDTLNNSLIFCGSSKLIDSIIVNNCYFHEIKKSCIFIETAHTKGLIVKNSTFANISTVKNSYYAGVIDARSSNIEYLVDHCTFYNCESMSADYGVVGKLTASTKGVVSNCIFAMPASYGGGRAIHMIDGNKVKNCLTYNYTSDSNTGIRSSVTQTNCIYNTNPLFVDVTKGYQIKGDWGKGEISPARRAATDGTDLGDPRWYTAETLPEVDFSEPYECTAAMAQLSGHIALVNKDSLVFSHDGNNQDGVAKWKMNITKSCYFSVAINLTPTSSSGHLFKVSLLDSKGNVLDSIEESSTAWASVNLSGILYVPEEGDYYIKLSNSTPHSSTRLTGLTLTYYDDPMNIYLDATVWDAGEGTENYAVWDSEHLRWSKFMTLVAGEDHLYVATMPRNDKQLIFVRLNGNTAKEAPSWDDKWNETNGLTRSGYDNLYTITGWGSGENAKSTGEWSVYGAKYYIAGDFTSWDDEKIPVCDGNSYTITGLTAGVHSFKIVDGGNWYGMSALASIAGGYLYPAGDDAILFKLAAAGDVTITYIKNTELSIEGAIAPDVALNGAEDIFGGWDGEKSIVMTAQEGGVYASKTMALPAGNYNIKVVFEGQWLSCNGENDTQYYITSDNHTVSGLSTDKNPFLLQAEKAGDYTFTWTFATGTLDVTFPSPATDIDNTVVGEKAVKLMENGQLVIIKNGVRYNVLGTVIK